MDIADIVSTEYETADLETPVSKLVGRFEDSSVKAIVVTDGDRFEGLITRRQLAATHHPPEEKARSLLWSVPTVEETENVRTVARLMVGADTKVLPIVDDDEVRGVVEADALIEKVRPYLDVVTVEDVYTPNLVTVEPESTMGKALHAFREHRVTHLPVVESDSPVGIVSLTDVLTFTTRATQKAEGGSPGTFEGGQGQSHGGFGERKGERRRLLDLPVRDVMSEPVGTVTADESLDDAVDQMFDYGVSSLVVVDEEGDTSGIVTKTDVLRSLTWTDEGRQPVQVYGIDLLDDLTYDDVADMVDSVADKYAEMNVLEAKIHLQEHDEKLRGTPLILARIRLFTDKGLFIASDEGYGARHALNLARNALEREILKGKTYGESKKHPETNYVDALYGWWLTG